MTDIIEFPTPDVVETPINHNALMDFAEAWDIDTEEQLYALNEWMVKLIQALDDVEDDDDDEEEDPTPTYLENTIYPKLVVEFLEEYDVRCDADMEEFTQMIHVLTAEPNVPLLVMN